MPRKPASKCKVCGSTDIYIVTRSDGTIYKREFCEEHFKEYRNKVERDRVAARKGGVPEGWRTSEPAKGYKERGLDAIVIDNNNCTVSYYKDGFQKSWKLKTLKRYNSRKKLVAFYSQLGYTDDSRDANKHIIVRPIASRSKIAQKMRNSRNANDAKKKTPTEAGHSPRQRRESYR